MYITFIKCQCKLTVLSSSSLNKLTCNIIKKKVAIVVENMDNVEGEILCGGDNWGGADTVVLSESDTVSR